MQKYKAYFIVGAICFVIGGATLFAICQRTNNSTIERMSGEIRDGLAINRDLQDKHSKLEKSNSESLATIDGLNKRLRNSQATIGNMQAVIDGFSGGLDQTGTDIRDVINRLGKTKNIADTLP